MLELWKCLSNVSTNDECVNLRQFKEATKCWIAKVLQTQTQDGNNNIEKEFYKYEAMFLFSLSLFYLENRIAYYGMVRCDL